MNFIIRDLQQKNKTFENGVAYFVGNALSHDGSEDFVTEIIEPDIPIQKSDYQCGKQFYPEQIIQLYNCYEDYGIVFVSGETTSYYLVNNHVIREIYSIEIQRQKNHRMGGQSSGRFMRIRENQIHEYIKLIVEKLNQIYKTRNVREIIICGNSDIKNEIPNSEFLEQEIKRKIRKNVLIITAPTHQNLINLVSDTSQRNNKCLHKIFEQIFDQFSRGETDFLIYGSDDILTNKISEHSVKYVILTEQKANQYGKTILSEIKSCGGEYFIVYPDDQEIFQFIANTNGFIACSHIAEHDN